MGCQMMPIINHHIPIIGHDTALHGKDSIPNHCGRSMGLFSLTVFAITKWRVTIERASAFSLSICSSERGA